MADPDAIRYLRIAQADLNGASLLGTLLISGACLAWRSGNNLSQRLSLLSPWWRCRKAGWGGVPQPRQRL